jgi:hypothetical protein
VRLHGRFDLATGRRELTDIRKLLRKKAAPLPLTQSDDAWEAQVEGAPSPYLKLQARSASQYVADN